MLVKHFRRLTRQVIDRRISDPNVLRDLASTAEILNSSPQFHGWNYGREPSVPAIRDSDGSSISRAIAWWNGLAGRNVVQKGTVEKAVGSSLELLRSRGVDLTEAAISAQLELLLRHVEIARGDALSRFSSELTPLERRLEKLDVAILFSREARRQSDVRFLNAALKLNDYAYSSGILRQGPTVVGRFVRSLAEQEVLMLEWSLPCALPFSPPYKAALTRAS